MDAAHRLIRAAPPMGVGTLTLFALSADNWQRPAAEVRAILELVEAYLREECPALARRGIRLSVLGRRDRLPASLREAIAAAEEITAGGRRMHLRLAVDYSAREAILRAACRLYTSLEVSQPAFARLLAGGTADRPAPLEVDLLIRTGGEQRLSDFLLWECAYAELWFTDKMWPDFEPADLQAALADYRMRERRFGRLAAAS